MSKKLSKRYVLKLSDCKKFEVLGKNEKGEDDKLFLRAAELSILESIFRTAATLQKSVASQFECMEIVSTIKNLDDETESIELTPADLGYLKSTVANKDVKMNIGFTYLIDLYRQLADEEKMLVEDGE